MSTTPNNLKFMDESTAISSGRIYCKDFCKVCGNKFDKKSNRFYAQWYYWQNGYCSKTCCEFDDGIPIEQSEYHPMIR